MTERSNQVRLARKLRRDAFNGQNGWRLRQGTVVTTNYTVTPPMIGPQVNVSLATVGGSNLIPCYFFNSYWPQSGHVVWVAQRGPDAFVIGRVNRGTGWTTMTLLNSWVAFGGVYEVPQWRIRPDGVVEFRGAMKHAVTSTVGAFWNTPAGLEPANRHVLGAVFSAGPGNARIDLAELGAPSQLVLVQYVPAGTNGGLVALDGCHYMPDYS